MIEKLFTIQLEDVVFQVQEEHDFSWLQMLGHVFCVFDQQDSGNISFGVEKDGDRRFIKYAGAKPLHFAGDKHNAIQSLRDAVHLYDELSHPCLIELIDHFEIGSGYAAVFKWFEGESLHAHWSYPPPAKYNNPASPYYRFRQLTVEQRIVSLANIYSFHVDVENRGWVAVDFYDGSLICDFKSNETKICDIDLYQRKPFINTMGRLWGSSRFMSPEEFVMDAQIDERTNVFTMGAVAFALIGGELDRSFTKWEAGKGLYEVALRAVNPDRELRYTNVAEFKAAWDEVKTLNKE
ncbi:serine/threonine protein kinase [Paenibacillus baekrokdamisoli]|uniref:Serine/threonine protein kinase n=1 Tax=Paenibacillus baekrokdamisoli TaxID=1712516 RepID=A0A3G9JHF5_9BACL|nr:serine/threonine protein kinase [Paenibacillus baekrokdamisoli]MBB3072843.1 serine/threonine-protein kinase [Paenibacillus baekrokdamisoli]BBH24403.1 serine/threonine protein kinase [Paenibacillus baekrokdamisoli]